MRIELLSEESIGVRRAAWVSAVDLFRWENDNETAFALYAAVPRASDLYFVASEPSRTGRVAWRGARPAPDALAESLAVEQLVLFPENLAWALRYSADPGRVCFGFPAAG